MNKNTDGWGNREKCAINFASFVLQLRDYFRGDIWAEAYIKWGSCISYLLRVTNYPRTYQFKTKSLLSQYFRVPAPGHGLAGSSVPGSAAPARLPSRWALGLQSLQRRTGKDLPPISLRRLLAGFSSSQAVGMSVSVLTGCWPRATFSSLSYQPLHRAAHKWQLASLEQVLEKSRREYARMRSQPL